jgi:PPOX class probable FMN-dependent enzyme
MTACVSPSWWCPVLVDRPSPIAPATCCASESLLHQLTAQQMSNSVASSLNASAYANATLRSFVAHTPEQKCSTFQVSPPRSLSLLTRSKVAHVDPIDCITGSDALRSLFRAPSQRALDKEIDHIDDVAADVIGAAPLFILATSDGDRVDISPRGGEPGFVKVLDRTHLAFGDLSGNNRIDSYRNLIGHDRVAMLFLIPGLEDSMRVNGRASITVDEGIRRQCRSGDRVPNLAVIIEVDTCFMHCGKALRRSAVWEPSTWPAADERPTGADMLKAHTGDAASTNDIAAVLEEAYQRTLWEPGGAG